MKKRPVCRAAAAFLAGLLSSFWKIPGWLLGTAFLAPGLVTVKKRGPALGLLLYPVFFLAGMAAAGAAGASVPYAREGSRAVVTGKIYDYQIKNHTVYYYIKTASAYHGVMAAADQIYFSEKNPSYKNTENEENSRDQILSLGMTVRAEGVVDLFETPTNPGQFDLRLYYKSRNIDLQLKKASVTVVDGRRSLLRDGLKRLQRRLCGQLYRLLEEKDAGVLAAMLFGEKSGLDSDLRAMYQRNGIAHILAISGLHISILGMCVYRLLRKLGCPMAPAAAAGSVFTLCFGLMIGMPVSALRAVVMYITAMAARTLGRSYDMASALSLAAILVLVRQPYALFTSSMQYSFGAVFALLLLPGEYIPKLKNSMANRMLTGLAASVSVLVFTLPIQLYHSFFVPLYACVLNLVVIPSMTVILLCAMAGVLLPALFGGLFSQAGSLLLFPCRLLLDFFGCLCRTAEKLPGHLLIPGRPGIFRILFFYALLGLLLFGAYRSKKRKLLLLLPVVCMALFVRMPGSGGLEIAMLDVGQGECIVFHTGDGRAFLSDGGSTDVSEVGFYRIKPFLLSRGISQVEAVFVSHWDTDHISGILELLEENRKEITVKRLLLPDGDRCRLGEKEKKQFAKLVEAAGRADVPVQFVEAGNRFLFSDMRLDCLAPNYREEAKDVNGYSASYTFAYGKFSMLLTGDLPAENEKPLLKSDKLAGRVLKVAHHGSRNSTSEELLEKLQPALALISCGKDNSYGHPHKELLSRLTEAGSGIYCTAETGAICLQVKKDGRLRVKLGHDSPFKTMFSRSANTSMAFNSS